MPSPLAVTIVWHMHQPYYKDPLVGEYVMPWVYLHGIKDYLDMPAIVDRVEGARCVFNLVPSLLEQLHEYASGEAVDPFLAAGRKHPSELTLEERNLVTEHFFSAHRPTMIDPYPRYAELASLCDPSRPGRKGGMHLSDQEIMDLQVWFFLAWTGNEARRRSPLVDELVKKGRDFTQDDKMALFDLHREILAAIIPLYRKLHEEGKIEISVTPWFHPILPLLCTTDDAHVAMPHAPLPSPPFAAPEDARGQIVRGKEILTRFLGITPVGIWPSEGSVSDRALELIADAGFEWCATDEGILARSFPDGSGPRRERLHAPVRWESGGKRLSLLFRDHALSDLIGFTYSSWEPQKAVDDFVGRLHGIRKDIPGARYVAIILDGENAWEYYPNNGLTFLSRLYEAIGKDRSLVLETCSRVVSTIPPCGTVAHIHPGSWINADYGVWIGHPEENRGWELLRETREWVVRRRPDVARILERGGEASDGDDPVAHTIVRSLYAAEGSDWFWWYGDDHFTPHADRFDLLFRRHLMSVYRYLGDPVPAVLYEPIKKRPVSGIIRTPTAFITPRITGLVGDYFEWLAAGLCDLCARMTTMHASESILHHLYYGYDRVNFYVRIDGIRPLDRLLTLQETITLLIRCRGGEFRIVMDRRGGDRALQTLRDGKWDDTGHNCHWQIRKILELRIPLAPLGLDSGDTLSLQVVLGDEGGERRRFPPDGPIPVVYQGEGIELDSWII